MAVKLKGPAGHGGFSFRGESFEPDGNGQIDVAHEALDEAFSHGFTLCTGDQDGGPETPLDLAKMKKADLLAFAKDSLGLELDANATNKELIAAIEEATDAKAAAPTA